MKELAANTPLGRLTLAIVALGLCLMLLVFGLLHSALARLERQRGLRQRMVAERVFDEVEREIGTVLQHEAERPSEAYDADQTDPVRWSAFVVGYYRRDPELTLLARSSLAPERERALIRAIAQVQSELAASPPTAAARVRGAAPDPRTPSAGEPRSSPDVLRQLNRSIKLRERRMHDFMTSFAVAATGNLMVAERYSVDAEREEGLVIDVTCLVETVQGWVLGSQGLRQLATLRLSPPASTGPSARGYVFTHRLAAPFQSYSIELQLVRLDDADESSALYGFAALFVVAAGLGLFAIGRMAVVQVAFAERRNDFVSAVTHELRTPLTAIRMYGEMLRDGMVSDEQQKLEYYATITAESERLTRLINNVMEHARLRRGQRHAHLESGDAGAIVREVVELMRPHIEREGFALQLDVAPGLPAVELERDALKQMLFNVLDNALKYGRGEARAQIDVVCAAADSGGVSVSVRDYGPGVADGQLQAVFEAFVRAESELTRRHQGTGLGLALVRDLVALMQGSVQGKNRAPGFELRILLRAA